MSASWASYNPWTHYAFGNVATYAQDAVSIVNFGGNANGTTDNTAALAAAQATATRLGTYRLYFPQNGAAGTATYYFAGIPNFNGFTLMADPGVTLSVASSNSTTWKGATFGTDIAITSRDRGNTATMLTNSYSKEVYALAANNDDWVGVKSVTNMNATWWNNGVRQTTYDANGAFFSTFGGTLIQGVASPSTFTVLDGVRYLAQGPLSFSTPTYLHVTQFQPDIGAMYTSCMWPDVPETNAGAQAGVIVSPTGSDNTTFVWYSVDKSGNLVNHLRSGGAYHSSITSHITAAQLTSAYTLSAGITGGEVAANGSFLMAARLPSPTQLEVYLNGSLMDSIQLPFAAAWLGFGTNGVSGVSPPQGLQNLRWGSISRGVVTRPASGKTLNIVSFGDSITYGEGSNLSYADLLPQLLEGARGITRTSVLNLAHSGDMAANQLSTAIGYSTLGAYANYDVATLLVGTNDIQVQQGAGVLVYDSCLVSTISTLALAGIKNVVLGLPPLFINEYSTGLGFATSNFDQGGLFRAKVLEVASRFNGSTAPIVSIADTMSELGRIAPDTALSMLRDNLHPLPLSHVLMSRCFARSIAAATDAEQATPTSVVVTPFPASAFANGWTNFGGGYQTAGYWKDSNNVVHVIGLVSGGTVAGGTTIVQLPYGCWPSATRMLTTTASGGGASVQVMATGAVQTSVNCSASWTSLEVSFNV
jgi:lysophospholipase L1-like esterase